VFYDALTGEVWPSILVGAALFTINAALAFYASYLYHAGAMDHITYEGVYDPPEVYGKPPLVRLFSIIFILKLGFVCLMTLVGWIVIVHQFNRPDIYLFVLGGLFLYQLADILIEFRRVILFRSALRGEGIRGQIIFSKRQVWTQTILELYGFVILYLLIFFLTGGWFFLGGSVTCFISSRRQRDWVVVKT
jgi:hypothetical protein